MSRLVSRDAELRAVTAFLHSADTEPAALVLEGMPGIGKTTLWLAGIERAREMNFRVLAARSAEAESVLSYSSLADLFGGIDEVVWSALPDPQRRALDHVLLRADADDEATDSRAVAAAVLSIIQRLAVESPVLVAIDDLQWLDMSSAQALAFALRRITGPIAVLATSRVGRDSAGKTAWLQLPNPGSIDRISLSPLGIGDLHTIITDRIGGSFLSPTMYKIHEVSGGNPFYGLELARSLEGRTFSPTLLPASLAELVRQRVGRQDPDVRQALLAIACSAAATVDLVSRAIEIEAADLLSLLADVEADGLVEIDGQQVRLAHPLLARGVYTDASPTLRRTMHARLAELVDEPESRARHLALATTTATLTTLESLDVAADLARKRGAPAAAGELLDLALALGGDTPDRLIRSADHHAAAGDPGRASDLLNKAIAESPAGAVRARALTLLAIISIFGDSLLEGIGLLERALTEGGHEDAPLRAHILATLAFSLLNSGQLTAGLQTADHAVNAAAESGAPPLISQALGMRAMARFMNGMGVDRVGLDRALQLEDPAAGIPIAFRPTVQNTFLLAWSGELARARDALAHIRRGCLERGEEGELIVMSFHAGLVATWLGDMTQAAVIAEDMVRRARQLGGDFPIFQALTIRGLIRAYAGREVDARSDLTEAIAACERCGMTAMAEWPVTALGFLEVSLGNHQAAMSALAPLMTKVFATPDATAIIAAAFVPDAIEACVQLGRLDEAEALVGLLERNGRRLDDGWMLAVAARGRGMLRTATGDHAGTMRSLTDAMLRHDQISMPFERARTLLLLGGLQRRRRQQPAATASLSEAFRILEELNTPLWAARAAAELAGGKAGARQTILTPAEQRVARLTASGMTNGEVAAELFISPKTVEFHLAGIYRKLGIRSRAELGRRIQDLES